MSLDAITKDAQSAFAQAAKEIDTWKCDECGDTINLPGTVHLEWGNPECGVCRKSGKTVLRRLVNIANLN